MTLARRLLLGSLGVISVMMIFLLAIANEQLRDRLYAQTAASLEREARMVAERWRTVEDADAVADTLSAILGHRVTLIDGAGRVRGDSDFDGPTLAALENHGGRPEVSAAQARGVGHATRTSPSRGDDEMYAAVRTPLGVARVAVGTRTVDRIVWGARRDVLLAGLMAAAAALVVAWMFSRSVSRPIAELSRVAGEIAAGDTARRLSLAAPGEVGDLATALQTMTEQLSARLQALTHEEMLMSALVDALDEGVVAVDGRRTVLRLNASAREMLGVVDTVPFPADHLSRDPVLRGALGDALRGAATDAAELHVGTRTLLLTARPLSTGGALLALLDLTALRRLEAVRRDFVANVSHELKTPLTVISGFAETLAEDDPHPAQRKQFVEAIRSNALRMQRLVDDLLDLSRIESGGWHPTVALVELPALVREAFDGVAATAGERGIELRAELAPDATSLHADPLAVRQVLGNLVQNAVRYTERGTVTIATRRIGDATEISVRDTGIGIPPEHLPRIFERFYRVDTGRSRSVGGTGLGLAIVRHLVEAHGGRVTAESVPGAGTTITARFPAAAWTVPVSGS